MGRGDNHELTPGEEELAAAEAATRQLLARHGEPAPAAPPPALAARVLAALPARQAGIVRSSRRPALAWAFAALLLPLFGLGVWGVLLNSAGLAELFGGPSSGPGQLILGLALAAKPLVNLVLAAGAYGFVAALALAGGVWLWWRLVRDIPARVEV